MKAHIKFSAILAAMLGTAGGLLILLSTRAHATTPSPNLPPRPASKPGPNRIHATPHAAPADVMAPARTVAADDDHIAVGILDDRRQFALSMIETGINDTEVGSAGEVSRYQIMPSVWRHYSRSRRYQDPAVSVVVARKHWAALYKSFKARAHREPSDFDMYVLWNTRYGYYAKHGFNPSRLHSVVRNRAQRFVNLVQLAVSQYAAR